MHGQGIFTFGNGDIYVGEFANNKCNGYGTYTFNSGVWAGGVFEGDWLNNKMHGLGTFTFANGDKYEGEFSRNKITKIIITFFISSPSYILLHFSKHIQIHFKKKKINKRS